MKMPGESRPSSFEAVFAAYAVVATFALGYGHWRLATRQNEQDAKIEQQRQEQQAAVLDRDQIGVVQPRRRSPVTGWNN